MSAGTNEMAAHEGIRERDKRIAELEAENERLRHGLLEVKIQKLRAGPSSFLLTNIFGEDKTLEEYNARIDAVRGEKRVEK